MNNNEYINSDYDNNNHHIQDDNTNLKQKQSQAWGTWEELLLACAVKRHGFGDWDAVAKEVRSRTCLPALLASAHNCRQKYRDLKRRFQESGDGGGKSETVVTMEVEEEEDEEKGGEEEEKVGNIPWLEQLRSLRVAELRREVQQYDVSILSLQLKVKKLEEEREQKPDLEDDMKRDRTENNDSEPTRSNREKAVSAEESDRENRSINESNSTGSVGKTDERVAGDEPSQARDNSGNNNINNNNNNNKPDPDPANKAATEAEEEGSISRGSEASHSDELGESGTSGGLGKKWRRKGRKNSSSKDNHDGDGGDIRSVGSKSQPLISLLELIRSHPRGSLFERRLRSQDTKDYKILVKEHLDIDTIHRKLEQGYYDSSRLTLYRDLQLLFTNVIIFFPSSSSESMVAHELRSLVFDEMRKETGKSGPNLLHREAFVRLRTADTTNSTKLDAETSDSSLSRQKSSGTLVVCKKRSSVSTPSSSSLSQKEETREEISEEKENIVTGVRSSRRSNKVVSAVVANITKTGKAKNKQKQTESKTNSSDDNNSKQESVKTEKKVVSSEKKKSMADFLNRIKKNSPTKEDSAGKAQNKNSGSSKKESKSKPRELRSNSVNKKKADVETTPLKRTPGRPQKKTTEPPASATANASASGKRGRETGSTGKDNKQPKKRSRR